MRNATSSAERHCPRCGVANLPGSRFCDQCGSGFSSDDSEKVVRIGRNPDSDIFLDYPMVSWDHARIIRRGSQAILEDLGSSNGTAIGHPDNRIQAIPLEPDMGVYFGSFHIPARQLLQGHLSRGMKAHTTLAFRGDTMVLGRAPNCDQVLDYPMVSWNHARLSRTQGGYVVEDLGSSNGTFLNGRRIQKITPVLPGDVVGLGSFSFTLNSAGKLEKRNYQGNLTIEARQVCIDVPGKRLVEDVSITVFSSEMVALMGTSGAGKTTLLNALCGYSKPSQGVVYYNGQDLYSNYDQFRNLIGYAPQDDIMHRELTVYEALYFTAKLRLPDDFSPVELDGRVRKAIAQVNLTGTENVLIGSPEKKGISGGQRKRVNIAMELLTEPEVLFLDEPTSGLSSKDSLELLEVLRKLADSGKMILMIIHQPSPDIFRKMDNLIQLAKDKQSDEPGRLVYYGPAYPDAIAFFSPSSSEGSEPRPEAIEMGLERKSVGEWVRKFSTSPYRKQFVDNRQGSVPTSSAPELGGASGRRAGMGQWATLFKRMLVVKRRDTWNTIILLGQAPLIAFLLVLGFGESSSTPGDTRNIPTVLFLEAVAALWFGCSNSAREIIGEWAVYRRERMATLKIPSYVSSKFAVLGMLCLIQCLTLSAIVHLGCGIKAPWFPMFGTLLLASFVGLAVGLTISALAKTTETAVAIVPLVLLPMVILGGTMKPVHKLPGSVKPISAIMPSRWAFEALLVQESEKHNILTDLASGIPNLEMDLAAPFFPVNDRRPPQESILILGSMFLVLSLGTCAILRRKDTL